MRAPSPDALVAARVVWGVVREGAARDEEGGAVVPLVDAVRRPISPPVGIASAFVFFSSTSANVLRGVALGAPPSFPDVSGPTFAVAPTAPLPPGLFVGVVVFDIIASPHFSVEVELARFFAAAVALALTASVAGGLLLAATGLAADDATGSFATIALSAGVTGEGFFATPTAAIPRVFVATPPATDPARLLIAALPTPPLLLVPVTGGVLEPSLPAAGSFCSVPRGVAALLWAGEFRVVAVTDDADELRLPRSKEDFETPDLAVSAVTGVALNGPALGGNLIACSGGGDADLGASPADGVAAIFS